MQHPLERERGRRINDELWGPEWLWIAACSTGLSNKEGSFQLTVISSKLPFLGSLRAHCKYLELQGRHSSLFLKGSRMLREKDYNDPKPHKQHSSPSQQPLWWKHGL